MIDGISAVTLGTHEMPRAVRFYRSLGFEVLHGGDESSFTSFRAGTSYLNLIAQPAGRRWFWWGRVIFYVADVDALYDRALAAGYQRATAPRDAEWGERFFHLTDPDGHELLALRALANGTLADLAGVGGDPVAAWRRGDPLVMRRLAGLELKRAGVRPPRGFSRPSS